MSEHTITLASLAAIADEIVAEESTKRNHLTTMIRHYARILAVREPHRFAAMPIEYSDEDGHWDNSYPPEQEWKDRNGPDAMTLIKGDWDQIATSSGFYYEWRAATNDYGLYVTPLGDLLGASYTGEGRFGQFAAHPGDTDVRIEVEYDRLDLANVTTERLVQAEADMRELAFPLIAERQKRA